jgi:hypothetical protein
MRATGGIALAAAMLTIAAMPAAAGADTPWSMGAAKVDTTPPAFDAGQDLQDFPELDAARGISCPRFIFTGPRLWRFEEPYQDQDGSGDFSYPASGGPGTAPAPEPFCDYNDNNRWDGIYLSGGADQKAKVVHDPIDARAVAFSDGSKTVVLASVVAQGIFENYVREARVKAMALAGEAPHQTSCGQIDEMVVSSNHNESSPDTVGIYGAPPDPTGTFGLNSSIDEYYMDWLDERIADAAVAACDDRRPASLRAVEFPVPPDLEQEIPRRFPTADDFGDPASIDPKVRVLQARDASGDPIFTMMNLADHNQDIGHSDDYDTSHSVSSDWPGYFHRRLEDDIGGMAMFLAGDIGSQEDLITVPRIPDPPCDNGHNGCFPQVELTGARIADHVASALTNAEPVALGPIDGRRTEFCAPLENNLFRAAFEAGLFGEREGYTDCQPTGRAGNEVHTSVGVLDIGEELQFIVNPGEAFPALMLGGPWGIEDASCPNRENPPVPTWHARAKYRFQVGLGDDLIGYEKPAWSFLYDTPGSFTPTDGCTSDPHGHSHALEDEAVGPVAGNMVAENLTALLDRDPDPAAEIRRGRYVKEDGTLTDAYTAPLDQGAPGHFPTDAAAIWLADPGSTTLDAAAGSPDSGTIVALDGIASFGDRPVDANGKFMDFDGARQPGGADVTTRGMLVTASDGRVQRRYYVDVYPALTISGSLGPANPVPYARPKGATPILVSLAVAYRPCTSPGEQHRGPLAGGSCNPPRAASDFLTVGTLDANGARANAAGSVRYDVAPLAPNVPIAIQTTDVRCISAGATACGSANAVAGADYTGELRESTTLRLTDRDYPSTDSGTTQDFSFPVTVPCAASADTGAGATCAISTSANSVVPGSVKSGKRAIWQLAQVEVFDGGSSGTAGASDATLFETQGLFVP